MKRPTRLTQQTSKWLAVTMLAGACVLAFAPGCAATGDEDTESSDLAMEQALAELGLSPQEPNTSDYDPEPLVSEDSMEVDSEAAPAATDAQKKAVKWMKNHVGSTEYEHKCETAVEVAYGTRYVYADAKEHWQSVEIHKNKNAPYGAFVFWNISQWGHVGISDGDGGFYSSGINGKIGHKNSLDFFNKYVGWAKGKKPKK
ncbi:hypothetical protein LVJ94_50380 [Pendulispora rubella]|uniref:CHAP domain-containing protein n=1 Tax=Pendulispora rubella TaxID=2741070 RepID=A0ABZ2L2S0_9BACT